MRKFTKNQIVTTILLIVLSFVFGSALSVKLTSDYYERLFDKFEFYHPAFNIVETVKTLRYLKENKTNDAIHYEEWRLDDNIMNLSNNMKRSKTNDERLMKFVVASLKIAALYRKQFPYDNFQTETTKKTVDLMLKYALSQNVPEKK